MEYLPVLFLLIAGLLVGGGALTLSALIGPKVKHSMKDQPFECGVPAHPNQSTRVSVKFYLIAILFLLFDVEVVFFYPWSVVFKEFLEINTFILIEMAAFVGILFVGYIYVLKKGALEWD